MSIRIYVRSKEHRRKIGEAQKGEKHHSYGKHLSIEHRRKLSESHKGEKNYFYGKHHTEETKRKIGTANLGKAGGRKGKHLSEEHRQKLSKAMKGKHPWNFQNYKSQEPYGKSWTYALKEAIRQRDGYKCQICGVPQIECIERLSVHHKDGVKTNLNPDNLISLCRKCHLTIHRGIVNR